MSFPAGVATRRVFVCLCLMCNVFNVPADCYALRMRMLRRRRYMQTRKTRHVSLTTRPTLSRPPKLPGVPSSSQSRAAEGGGLGRVLFHRAIQPAYPLVRLLLSENGFKTGQPGESGGRAKEKLHEEEKKGREDYSIWNVRRKNRAASLECPEQLTLISGWLLADVVAVASRH